MTANLLATAIPQRGLVYTDWGKIIRKRLSTYPENAAVDIAGGMNGRALRDLLDEGVISRGLVTNYLDKQDPAKADPRLEHLAGDILAPETWESIIDWVQQYQPRLLLHRPFGALQGLPASFYKGAAHLLLDVLPPGSIMFSQIPCSLNPKKIRALGASISDRPDVAVMKAGLEGMPYGAAIIIKKQHKP
jgi:hypothetical protein